MGLVVPSMAANAVLRSSSRESTRSRATTVRTKKWMLSSVSTRRAQSYTSLAVEWRKVRATWSNIRTAAPAVPKCTRSPPTVMDRSSSNPCQTHSLAAVEMAPSTTPFG